jgi:uncharacterized damage-inducible protein DinB
MSYMRVHDAFMNLTDLFLAELDREVAATRRVLQRVPEGRADWRPHPRSMPLGRLSALVAGMPGWIAMMIQTDEFDFAPDGKPADSTELGTVAELLTLLETSAAKARQALIDTDDDHLITNWKLKARGHVVTEVPRYLNIRDGVFNHLAHHRGQLTVYLRLTDSHVPSIYGPSADEPLAA